MHPMYFESKNFRATFSIIDFSYLASRLKTLLAGRQFGGEEKIAADAELASAIFTPFTARFDETEVVF